MRKQLHFNSIHTHFRRQNRLLDWYNYRLSSLQPEEVIQHLDQIFPDQSNMFKLNMSFGFILRNNKTGEHQYHYASRNNHHLFDSPLHIATAADLRPVCDALQGIDVPEWCFNNTPTPNCQSSYQRYLLYYQTSKSSCWARDMYFPLVHVHRCHAWHLHLSTNYTTPWLVIFT